MTQHKGQRIGYARVSSTDQNLARQLDVLGRVDRLFEEKQSGAQRAGRSALAELIAYARQGDIVVVSSMDRLARSVVDLNQIVAELIDKAVAVEFITESATFRAGTKDPFAEFQLNIMASFAQLEHSISKERQAEGIEAAKARGVYRGRAPTMKPYHLAISPVRLRTPCRPYERLTRLRDWTPGMFSATHQGASRPGQLSLVRHLFALFRHIVP